MSDFNFESKGIHIPSGATVSDTGDVVTLCPVCSHTRKKSNVPCLSVNLEKGVWNCHHCGWKGGFGASEEILDLPDDLPEFELPHPHLLLPPAINYLRSRGIDPQVAIANRAFSVPGEESKIGYPRF